MRDRERERDRERDRNRDRNRDRECVQECTRWEEEGSDILGGMRMQLFFFVFCFSFRFSPISEPDTPNGYNSFPLHRGGVTFERNSFTGANRASHAALNLITAVSRIANDG